MKRNALIAGALAAALVAVPLAACGSGSASTSDTSASTASSDAAASSDFDAVEAYWGQWRGSVATTGSTVYGDAAGTEPMLDIYLNQDGSCSVEPLEAHADLLTDEGTWEGTETTITMHLSSGDIELTVVKSGKAEADASAFDIADFETIDFDFYG